MPYAGPSDSASTATATRPSGHRRTRSSSNFSDERGPGAFAPLGQLPRLNKKAVFHINDNDDDDSERPSYPAYSPYAPINSLRLSMNAGRFSPSVEPPPRIEIPPHEPPSAVPFPTSSPSSPPPGLSLFIPSLSSSRNTSKCSTPSLPRTPSTPIILSNGKPLKSSLKGSSSTPNISDLPIRHIRAQSAPSTPNANKNVHFAEKDSGLETIRVFNRTGKPASLSKPSGEETETETEAESSFPFPILSSSSASSAGSATIVHELDTSPERTNQVPKPNPSPYAYVFLETLSLPRTRPPTLRGTVLVRNMSFEKTVAVRFTLDDWQTTSEVMGKHVVSLPGLPPPFPRARTMGDLAGNIATGQPTEDEHKEAGPAWDRFSFTIRLEDYETKLADRTLYLVVRYNPGSGGEYWDNNDGANYRVGFKRVAASPLPSPAISGAHSQQRTFSAPMTMKTTPTTGAISAPYAPPTRQLAPAPPQLTRSLSSPFPPVNPTFAEREQDQRELVTRRSLASPTAAYLSKKLSLSNYVAPTASSSMVTPPASPPDTIRIRSSSLPTEAGHNADDSKEQSDKDATPSRPALISRITMVQGHPATTLDPSTDLSSSWNRPPSPSAGSPPALSPLSIPGPSMSALTNQARSFGSMSYGFGFDGGSTLGYTRPQLLSPPRSKESSPASSGKSSPRREGSPERLGKSALGLEVSSPGAGSGAASVSVASLTNAVRELGLNIPPHAAANANARVDTSDPSYAALLKQWCFVQSSPDPAGATPAATATAAVTPSTPVPAVVGSGETTPTPGSVGKALGFGQHAGYGFPGFSFGLPDAGMVGGEFLVCCLRRAWRCRGAARCRRRCFRCMR
ncbi:carbohydrate-binding module family 21 protein [Polyporus arcularius HHB13444]|uniref:Carbohydrate-binding module family 21 protein n=1 Tax=Polyporus arcularius HHB13444 TaxID=1314778 RepID=A0A5C3PK16_9APHY|nr:carbohydrate-binding module family 21 protein [Polyporus arcularius HHB13444]